MRRMLIGCLAVLVGDIAAFFIVSTEPEHPWMWIMKIGFLLCFVGGSLLIIFALADIDSSDNNPNHKSGGPLPPGISLWG